MAAARLPVIPFCPAASTSVRAVSFHFVTSSAAYRDATDAANRHTIRFCIFLSSPRYVVLCCNREMLDMRRSLFGCSLQITLDQVAFKCLLRTVTGSPPIKSRGTRHPYCGTFPRCHRAERSRLHRYSLRQENQLR